MRKLLTVTLGVLVGLFVVEIGLRVAAAVVSRVALRGGIERSAGDKFRIFCVGDSNTYGAAVPRDQTYPANLERILNAAAGEDRFEVVNLGVPGSNSAQVIGRLPQYLQAYKPNLLLVLTGVNDYWNPAEVGDPGAESLGAHLHRLLLHLRTYRLAVLVFDYFRYGAAAGGAAEATLKTTQLRKDAAPHGTADATVHELHVGDTTFDFRNPRRTLLLTEEEHQALLRRDLREIIQIAKTRGVPLVLPTYVADMGHYRTANVVILQEGGDAVAQLLLPDLIKRTPSLANEKERFFWDLHPKGPTYAAYALNLCDALVKKKLVPLESCDPPSVAAAPQAAAPQAAAPQAAAPQAAAPQAAAPQAALPDAAPRVAQ